MRLTLSEYHTNTAQQNVFITGDVKNTGSQYPGFKIVQEGNEIVETVVHGLNASSDLRGVLLIINVRFTVSGSSDVVWIG